MLERENKIVSQGTVLPGLYLQLKSRYWHLYFIDLLDTVSLFLTFLIDAFHWEKRLILTFST